MRIVQRRFALPAGVCARAAFAALFGTTAAFAERFHSARGDVDVAVLEWLSGVDQRLLSYTMCERDATGSVKDRTKCLETQAFTADDDAWRVDSHLKPDGSVGNLFLVDTKYECRADIVTIEAQCSCLKRIWGFASMVEAVVEQQTTASLDLWCQLAIDALSNLSTNATNNTSNSSNSGSGGSAAAAGAADASTSEEQAIVPAVVAMQSGSTGSGSRKHQRSRANYNRNRRPRVAELPQRSVLPHKQLSTMKRVAQGHDSILRLLASGDVSMMNSPSDDDVRRATAQFDDDVMQKEHNDHRSRSRRRACVYCIVLIALMAILIAVITFWQQMPPMIASAVRTTTTTEQQQQQQYVVVRDAN
jgi:hypothetical protein